MKIYHICKWRLQEANKIALFCAITALSCLTSISNIKTDTSAHLCTTVQPPPLVVISQNASKLPTFGNHKRYTPDVLLPSSSSVLQSLKCVMRNRSPNEAHDKPLTKKRNRMKGWEYKQFALIHHTRSTNVSFLNDTRVWLIHQHIHSRDGRICKNRTPYRPLSRYDSWEVLNYFNSSKVFAGKICNGYADIMFVASIF